jgi:predicted O-linked N-acetylglucosamine transferase (SPINDLY family)
MANPQADAMFHAAFGHHKMGAVDAAKAGYERVLKLDRNHADALHYLGVIALQSGDFGRAAELIGKSLARAPHRPIALSNIGFALFKLGRYRDAVRACSKSLQLQPDNAATLVNRANAYAGLGELEMAERDYRSALTSDPDNAEYIFNLANAVLQKGDLERAVGLFGKALSRAPAVPEISQNLGVALTKLRRFEEALAHFERAIALRPDFAQAWSNRGNALRELRRPDEALASYRKATELDPAVAEAWSNCGNALCDLGRLEEALACFERAVELKPAYAEAWSNRADALRSLHRLDEAVESYARAHVLDPDLDYLGGDLLHARMHLCDWRDFDRAADALRRKIRNGFRAAHPFSVLSLFDDPEIHRIAAETFVADKFLLAAPAAPFERLRRDRIRVGYFSADFREHPVSYLVAGLIEAHDRSRFEIFGFSQYSRSRDAMQRRVAAAFDRYIEIDGTADSDVVRNCRELGLDIAVDLGGHTQEGRPGIFAARCAPVQISYIGYLGTSGIPNMDYLIADGIVVPEASEGHFREKIIALPHFQANDSGRPLPTRTVSRAEYGLPETGFVFCCFNNAYKILPQVFGVWMRILARVAGSVLFLYADSAAAQTNLRREAETRGISPERLVFGARLGREAYLARYRAADLFLDTVPYNAGTTASDALWMGLPVLTSPGQSFASRVAASLLTALDIEELVCDGLDRYEECAVSLAGDPGRLLEIRQRLENGRSGAALFDSARFAKSIENAYGQVYERFMAGDPPAPIRVTE